MPQQPNHRLPEEFGGNEWLVDELYEQFQQDRNSVDKKWWSLFESFESDNTGSDNGRHSAKRSSGSDPNPPTRELPVVQAEQDAPKASGESPAASQESGMPPVPKEESKNKNSGEPAASAKPSGEAKPAAKAEPKTETKPEKAPIPAQLPKSELNP